MAECCIVQLLAVFIHLSLMAIENVLLLLKIVMLFERIVYHDLCTLTPFERKTGPVS